MVSFKPHLPIPVQPVHRAPTPGLPYTRVVPYPLMFPGTKSNRGPPITRSVFVLAHVTRATISIAPAHHLMLLDGARFRETQDASPPDASAHFFLRKRRPTRCRPTCPWRIGFSFISRLRTSAQVRDRWLVAVGVFLSRRNAGTRWLA